MKYLISFCILLLCARAHAVAVKIEWDYKDVPPGIKIHTLKGNPKLWKTESLKQTSQLPIKDEIKDATLQLDPGDVRRFALVYTNTGEKPLYFFAAPHSAEPAENSLGFKFKCLCVNHAYKVAPGETWYRIVEFKLAPKFVGDKLTLKHQLIGIGKDRADDMNSAPPMDGAHEM
jgi:hypothetical protein